MTRPFGLRARVGGLALATLVLAQAVGFAVVAFWPAPPAPSMVPIEAIEALAGAQPAEGLRVRRRAAPPEGVPVPWLAGLASDRLGQAPDAVRAVWRTAPDIAIQVVGVGGPAAPIEDEAPGAVRIQAALARAGVRLPAFELAVREADGRWRIVGTADPGRGQWRRQVLLALVLGALLIAPLAWGMARRLTRPLQRLADASARLDLGADAPPVPIEGAAEIQVLARAIADAQHRLRAQAADVTGMLAAVAHDLRTPLTGLRLRAESAPEPDRARMVADIERMEAMIAQVLAYTQGQIAPLQPGPVDLAALARDLVDAARARGHACDLQPAPVVQVHGDALALRRALSNLIENALRYAGAAEVALHRQAGMVRVEVRDRGPGIPPEARARLVEPFQRLEHSRSRDTGGVGLGLAVAHSVAQRHGGRLVLDDRPGGGLVARLELPVSGVSI